MTSDHQNFKLFRNHYLFSKYWIIRTSNQTIYFMKQ